MKFRKSLTSIFLTLYCVSPLQASEFYAANISPTAYARNGVFQGYAIEIMNEVVRRLGYPQHTILLLPLKRALEDTRNNEKALLANIVRNPEREKHYKWLYKIRDITFHYVTLKGRKPVTHETAVNLRSVGVLSSAAVHEALRKQRGIHIQTTHNDAINLRMLVAGRIDAWFTSSVLLTGAMKKVRNVQLDDLWVSEPVEGSDSIYAAAGLGMPDEEVQRWRDAFNSMNKDGTYQAIMAKYLKSDQN